MLVLKYFAYAGSGLLALLFGLNWLVPETPITAVRTEVNRSSIRISSIERLPDRIVFDTSAPQPRRAVQAAQSSAFVFAQISPGPLARFEPKRQNNLSPKLTFSYSTDRFRPVI
jgi:hypothetical protein